MKMFAAGYQKLNFINLVWNASVMFDLKLDHTSLDLKSSPYRKF